MASRSGVPLMARIRSPVWSPATAAGERRRTDATTTPSAPPLPAEQALFMLLVLGGMRGIQESHPLHDVLESRNDGEDGGHPHDGLLRQRQLEPPRAQAGQDGENLKEGRRFAHPRWSRIDPDADHVDHER